jgi:hypothetical protein
VEVEGSDIELPPGTVWCIWWDSVSTWAYGFRINIFEDFAHIGDSPNYSYAYGNFSSPPSVNNMEWATVSGATTVGPQNIGIINMLINGTLNGLQESLQVMFNDPE